MVLAKGKDLKLQSSHKSDGSIDRYFSYQIKGKSDVIELRKLLELAAAPTNIENREGVFSIVFLEIKPICEYVHDTTLASIFAPIENNLKTIMPEDSSSADGDLPEYSFAPQEFITVVGQV